MAATLTRDDELLFFSFPIDKSRTEETTDINPVDKTPDLIVWGKATDGSLDNDLQVVDPSWSAKAIQEWYQTGANVRVQHQPQRDPAGKGIQIDATPDGTWVRTRVSEPVAKHLVRTGALNDYSVGISRPDIIRGPHPTLDPDGKAVNGIITGRKDGLSKICEISLVDRGSNFNSKFQLVKAAADGSCEWVGKMSGTDDSIVKAAPARSAFSPADLEKLLAHRRVAEQREAEDLPRFKAAATAEHKILGKKSRNFSAERRRELARAGHALDDGSYPIPDKDALRRAAILARSGHGDVAGARRLIARRAKELGVANPLNGDGDGKEKAADAPEAAVAQPAAVAKDDGGDEREPLHHDDGDDDDPDSDADAMDKAAAAVPDMGKKPKVPCPKCKARCKPGARFCGKCGGAMKADKASKPTPGDGVTGAAEAAVQPAPEHREPDGPAIEALEHDAHLPTVPDSSVKADDAAVKAALRLAALGVPRDQGALHDLLCPAFDGKAVDAAHPGADLSMVDELAWQAKALEIAASAPLEEAQAAARIWETARTLKSVTPDLAADVMAEARKAFRDANPGPGSAPEPGELSAHRFNRPYITAGHSAPSPDHAPPHRAPVQPGHISAGDFHRDLITEGHAADSPDNASARPEPVPAPEVPGVPSRVFYTTLQRQNARQAMSAMHDHIAASFPDLCPMHGPGRMGEPPSHARPVAVGVGGPVPHGAMKGSDAVPAMLDNGYVVPDRELAKAAKKERKRQKFAALLSEGVWTREEAEAWLVKNAGILRGEPIAEAVPGELVTLEAANPGVSPDVIKAAVTEATAPLLARLEKQEQMLDAIASQPDPAVQAYRSAAFPALATKSSPAPEGPAGIPARAALVQEQFVLDRIDSARNSTDPNVRLQAMWDLMGIHGLTGSGRA